MLDENMDIGDKLIRRYCPPLDETVFFALKSDYDLTDPEKTKSFTEALDTLKASALEQDYIEFDPSGTGGVNDSPQPASSTSKSALDEFDTSEDVTSITTGLSDLKWDETTDVGSNLEELSMQQKEAWLKSTFANIKPFTIAFTLKKCHGALDRSIDELLNISFLEDEAESSGRESPIPKGIEGFAELGTHVRGRKQRRNRKQIGTNESSRASSAAEELANISNGQRNVWHMFDEDVKFICSRTTLSPQAVKSAYHANSASLPATIRALLDKDLALFKTLDEAEPTLQSQLMELQHDFPTIPGPHLVAVLQIARNIPSAAHELCEVLIRSSEPLKATQLALTVQYAPVPLEENGMSFGAPKPSSWTNIATSAKPYSVTAHANASNTNFAKASAYARRGRSDHLMGGAAAYFSKLGREHAKAAKDMSAAAADSLVNSQSTSTVLDLHGVGVADAVRIAKTRVSNWWDGLGDAKYAHGGGGPARAGYRIVTGVGRHSRDGAPRIGPAVGRMLVREGWKVEVGYGELVAYGKTRR